MVYRPRERIFTPADFVAGDAFGTVKDYLRVTHAVEDTQIIEMTAAAVMAVENHTQRLLAERAAVLRLPGLPDGREAVELPGGPVSAVTAVTADGLPVTGFQTLGDSPARLIPNAAWPGVTGDAEGYPVTVAYTVGHKAVPYALLQAVKMIAGQFFERGAVDPTPDSLPLAARHLMEPYRIRAI